jgi:hypothetical protein
MPIKSTIDIHACYQCSHAYLMRSNPHDPIVSECLITKQREVASTPIMCRNFKQRLGEAEIHTMIPCCI